MSAPTHRSDTPATVMATYRVREDKEQEFLELLGRHHPALFEAGLVTLEPPVVYRNVEQGKPTYFEIFDWVDGEAPGKAHELPEVMAIWGPMGACVEERDGRPRFEFPHVERMKLEPSGS